MRILFLIIGSLFALQEVNGLILKTDKSQVDQLTVEGDCVNGKNSDGTCKKKGK